MSIIPDKKVEQVQFCESHWPIWTTNAVAIGLTAAQTLAFKNFTTAARSAFDAAQNAKQAYKAAVTAQDAALRLAVGNAADLIRVIKSFAELTANPDAVYSLAQIPPPATPVPASAPGKPTNIGITLLPTGAITLAWDADNATASTGGFFSVLRKLPGQAAFTTLGGAPGSTAETRRMSFTDETIPTSAAASGAQYIIQGQRGTLTGEPSDAVTVQFGVGEGVTVSGLSLAA
ncbi:MAG: hypothetical protein HEQ23_12640 [Tepidisphaera sp.]